MVKHFVGIIGSLLGALAGAWLMVAPTLLAYQPEDADWADPTFVDFWTGLPLIVVSVIGLILYSAGLAEELRNRGIIRRRSYDEPYREGETGMTQQQGSMEQTLLPLVTAMLQDMQEQRQQREAPDRAGTPGGNAHDERAANGGQQPQYERSTRQ